MVPNITSVSESFFKSKSAAVRWRSSKKQNMFRRIVAILTPDEKRIFAVLSTLDIVISLIDILSLAFLLWLIQFYIQPGVKPLFFVPHWLLNKNSVAPIAAFFLLFSAKNLLAFYIATKQNKFIAKVAVRISENNLIHYQNSDFQEFINVDSSVQIRKIAHQPFDFCMHLLAGVQQIITQTSLIVITIIAIIFFNVKLFLLLLLILLPPVIAVFYFVKKHLTIAKIHLKTSNQISLQYLMDALKGYVEGNIFGRNDFFLRRFVAHRTKFSQHLFDSISLQTLPSRLIEIFAVMGLFILIAIAKWTGNSDTGAFITIGAFMAAAYKIIPGIVKIVNTLGQMKAYEFSVNDIADSKEYDTHKTAKPNTRIQSLQFSNIGFHYNGKPVLTDLSFSLQKGDFIGITGNSGKGKTTIFNLLLGFLSPHSGEILINDLPVHKAEIKNFWTSIAYVRQQCFFIHDTVQRNITLEETGYNEMKLQFAIQGSGLDEFVNDSIEGPDKIITENGKNISGGQQQRIALARAVYKDADLILLDEPFNELDEASELSLLVHFKQLADSGKMVIMITHNKKALSYCSQIISLDQK